MKKQGKKIMLVLLLVVVLVGALLIPAKTESSVRAGQDIFVWITPACDCTIHNYLGCYCILPE